MNRWSSGRLSPGDALLASDLYPALRSFAAVVAPPGDDPDTLVVAALVLSLQARPLTERDHPASDVAALIYEAALPARQRWPVVGSRVPPPPQDASRYELELWRLPAKDRAVLYLSEEAQAGPEEIAQIVGGTPGAARRSVGRARRHLGTSPDAASTALGVLAQRGEPLTDAELTSSLESGLARPGAAVVVGRVAAAGDGPGADQPGSKRGLVAAGAAAALLLAVVLGGSVASDDGADPVPIEPIVLPDDETRPPTASSDERLPPITLSPETSEAPQRIATDVGDLDFTTLAYAPHTWFSGLVTTPFGAVAAPGLRWSDDYQQWQDIAIGHPYVTRAGDSVLAYGSNGNDDGGFGVRLAWDGDGWVEGARLQLPGPVNRIVVGSHGAVAFEETTLRFTGERWEYGPELAVYASSDGTTFLPATQPPRPSVSLVDSARTVPRPARSPSDMMEFRGGCGLGAWSTGSDLIFPTDDGFVAMTARHPDDWGVTPICEPQLWFSPDGDVWDRTGGDAPFGPGASVSSLANHDGRYAAVGTAVRSSGQGRVPALWVSTDGIAWTRHDIPIPAHATISAGELGWVLVGSDGLGSRLELWTAPDALRWDGPYEFSEVFGSRQLPRQVVVGPDRIIALGDHGLTIGRLPG